MLLVYWTFFEVILNFLVKSCDAAPVLNNLKMITFYSGRYDNPDIIEGDIYIPRSENGSMSAVKAQLRETPLWDGGLVHYKIDKTFDVWEREEIVGAMQHIEGVSCLKFRPRSHQEAYVHIQSKQGCYSEVGMSGLKQMVSLNFEVCATYGTILHELLHVLGLWHEQSRADRDRYVRVVWNNVVPRFKANFMKSQRVPYLDESYDYESIMHYFFNAFSRDPEQATLVPKTSNVKLINLGLAFKENRMTETDIRKLNRLYNCPLAGSTRPKDGFELGDGDLRVPPVE